MKKLLPIWLGVSFIIFVSVVFVNLYMQDPPTPDAPIPVVTINDSVVRVVSHTKVGVLSGYGFVVAHGEGTVILTSRMLFNGDGPVLVNGIEARVLLQDDVSGLVALSNERNLPGATLEDTPEGGISIYAETVTLVTRGKTINDAWFFLKDIPADKITGAPLIVDETLVGLVVGRSQTNDNVAIGASIGALRDFVNEVVQ